MTDFQKLLAELNEARAALEVKWQQRANVAGALAEAKAAVMAGSGSAAGVGQLASTLRELDETSAIETAKIERLKGNLRSTHNLAWSCEVHIRELLDELASCDRAEAAARRSFTLVALRRREAESRLEAAKAHKQRLWGRGEVPEPD